MGKSPESNPWFVAARAGSNEALGKALQACRNYLLLVAAKELNTELQARGWASDLVQETFLEAKQDFGRFQGKTQTELMAWLQQILVNNVAIKVSYPSLFSSTPKTF